MIHPDTFISDHGMGAMGADFSMHLKGEIKHDTLYRQADPVTVWRVSVNFLLAAGLNNVMI